MLDNTQNSTGTMCPLCSNELGLTRLHGVCRSCSWKQVQNLRSKRTSLLLEVSQTERQIQVLFSKLETPDGISLSLQTTHRCICGETSPSYLDIASHISLGDDVSHHRLEYGEDRARRILLEAHAKRQTTAKSSPTYSPRTHAEDDGAINV